MSSSGVAMLDMLDLLLLKRGIPSDDRTLTFRRVLGNPDSRVIYFLPWHTPFSFARQIGLLPLDYLACYEMPAAIVSSDPELSVAAMHALVEDARRLLALHETPAAAATIIGLSVGNYPATYLANLIGARLCSVAPADRADLMIWQSAAARLIKRRAIQRGVRLLQYSRAMLGCHPVCNLAGIAPDSVFLIGRRDPFIPHRRSAGLLQAIERHVPAARVVRLEGGHLKTLLASGRYQRALLDQPVARKTWQLTIPFGQAFARLPLAGG
jgi:hypothetical protein